MNLLVILCLLASIPPISADAGEVEVIITGIRNNRGQIVIGVFKDEDSFKREEAFISKSFQKKNIINGEMKVSFSMESGVWGLSLLDDENSSGLMEYTFIGIPREGFGFSDYYHTGLTKPKFEAFKFRLDNGQKKNISVKIRYM